MSDKKIFAIERPHSRLMKLHVIRTIFTGPLIVITLPYLFFRYHTMRGGGARCIQVRCHGDPPMSRLEYLRNLQSEIVELPFCPEAPIAREDPVGSSFRPTIV